ncbi:hypothetical protein MYU51_004839 [Penicillium brevicompactum]
MAMSLEKDRDGQPRFPGCSNITEYTFVGKLGEGTFGEVYKAKSKKDNTVVALKKILMHHEKEGFPITAIREIKLMKALSHINILQLKEMAIERGKGEGRKKPSMYMVFPYMEHDLSGLLENPAVHFSEPQIKCYLMQLLEGLKYLHGQRILHRDMKAANLLISNGGILQIADFGLARPYDDAPPLPGKGGGESKREYTALVVTRWYRPPELLLQLRKYTTAIDLWGVGCVFGEMFKGKPILTGNSDLNQAQLIFNLVGTPTEENMPGWSALPGCEGVKNFGYKRGNLAGSFQDGHPYRLFLQASLTPHQMAPGQALALVDPTLDMVVFLGRGAEADPLHQQAMDTFNDALLSHHQENPASLHGLLCHLINRGRGPHPTDPMGETIGVDNSPQADQEADRLTTTWTHMSQTTTIAMIVQGIRESMALPIPIGVHQAAATTDVNRHGGEAEALASERPVEAEARMS